MMLLSNLRRRAVNDYQHIVACHFVKCWLVLVFVHFIIQVVLQGLTLSDNKQAMDITDLCLSVVQVPNGLPLLANDNLSMCDGIPGRDNVTCVLIASTGALNPSSLNDMNMGAFAGFDLDDIHNITLSGSERFITGRCAMSLQWIHDVFRNSVAEDIATICFQFWLLIVSLLAVIQDSIPHLAVCIACHFLDVTWVGFRIKMTLTLQQRYNAFVVDGSCGGEDLLGSWWDQRLAHAVPLFATNVVIFILLGTLAVILFQRFANNSFSRVGASPQIARMYKIALSFSVFLQLAVFFTAMAVGMWIDTLSYGVINAFAKNIQVYQATFIFLAVVIAPWIASGWWAVFREVKWAFILFGVLHAFGLIIWPPLFGSPTYRYVFGTWTFFAGVSVTSYLFMIVTTILAFVCRMNFGKGLKHFLRVEAALRSSGFPASYFTNDPEYPSKDSPTSFNFSLLDVEKTRKGYPEDEKEGPTDIRSYAYPLDSTEYSMHSLALKTSTNNSNAPTPVLIAFPPPGVTNTKMARARSNGSVKTVSRASVKSESHIDSDRTKSGINTRDESWIQPPPEAFLLAPYKETRSRKDTPSLLTQATGTSTGSYSQAAVITYARKSPFVSATAKTLRMNTMSSRDTQSGGLEIIGGADQDVASWDKSPPRPDEHGRI